jgi:hypothetical protein
MSDIKPLSNSSKIAAPLIKKNDVSDMKEIHKNEKPNVKENNKSEGKDVGGKIDVNA